MKRILSTMKRIATSLALAMFAAAALAAPPDVASDIQGAVLVPLTSLPRSPEPRSPDDDCTGYRVKPVSAAAKSVAALGWIVTSDVPLGRYRAVSFASGFAPETSSICIARNGNIAVFDGADLIALAYTTKSARWTLGKIEPLESGALLVWSGDGPVAPVGELHEQNGGFRLTALADERTFCNGRATVPNVYAKSIKAARAILISHGWQPDPPADPPVDGDGAAQLAKRGIVEAESCAGTGVGYCEFNYRAPVGVLHVATIGGDWESGADDTVVRYWVTCRAK